MIVVEGNRCKAENARRSGVFAPPDVTGPGCGNAAGTVSYLVFPTDYFAFS